MEHGARVLFDAKDALAVYNAGNNPDPFVQDDIDEHLAEVAPENIFNVQACFELLEATDPDPQASSLAVDILRKVYGRKSDEYLDAMATVWNKPRLRRTFWWRAFWDGMAGWGEDVDTKLGRDHFTLWR